jgi:Fe2+ or Zn2+ uptake regulation protein
MVQTRYSKQRELIYNALVSTKEHPSAEMIFKKLKPISQLRYCIPKFKSFS